MCDVHGPHRLPETVFCAWTGVGGASIRECKIERAEPRGKWRVEKENPATAPPSYCSFILPTMECETTPHVTPHGSPQEKRNQ